MGFPKALLRYQGQHLLQHLVQMHLQSGLQVFVVLGTGYRRITGALDLKEVTVLINPDPQRGPLSSLWTVLSQVIERSGLLVHPVDHGLVSRHTIQTLRDLHSQSPEKIIIPKFGEKKGHPVLFPRQFYPLLQSAPLQEGARRVVRDHPHNIRYTAVADAAILSNLNRPEDLPASVTIPSASSIQTLR